MKTHNFMEERMKWDNDLDEEYRNLLKRFKKREKLLAPLMFPYMEEKRRKENGINMGDVSTPPTSFEGISA